MRAPKAFRGLPREVVVLSAVAFSVAVGFGIVAPAIPLFASRFGVGKAAAATVISAFAFMRFVSALGAGRLVDRIGERVCLATGIGVVAASSALAGLASSYSQLLILRGIGGIGSAMFSVGAASLLFRVVPSAQRGRATSLWYGGFLIGGITGPAFGGAIATVSIRAPFFIYAGTLAVAGTIAMVALRSTPLADPADKTAAGRVRLGTALRDPSYRAALAANFADGWAVMGVRSALLPLFVVEGLHRSIVWTGIGFFIVAGVNAAVLLPAGSWADRYGRKPLLVGGLAFSSLSLAVLGIQQTLPGYLVALALLGFGSGLLDVAPAAIVGDVSGGRGGTVVAAFQMSGDAGVVSGPVIAGRLADVTSYGVAFGTTSGVLGAAAVLALFAPETRGRSGTVSSGGGEGVGQVGEQVVDVLDADGEPHQVVGDLER
ncbi:MAG: transporter, family, multidrug resistance protein [Frankiaceae bacterium]|nr:transporter, family, multidrug resistance protein [Frankiaceae bacterium]